MPSFFSLQPPLIESAWKCQLRFSKVNGNPVGNFMRKLCFFSVLILLSTSFQGVLYGAVEDSKDKSLIVKDGKLLSHLFWVFVRDTTITTKMDPRLILVLRATPNDITQST